MIRSWLACEAILRLAISVVIYWAFLFINPNLIIDTDNLINLPLFLFEVAVIVYTTIKTFYSFKRAKAGLNYYVTPLWVNIEIIFNIIWILGVAALAGYFKDSDVLALQESSLWLAFLDVHLILNLLITAAIQREIHNFIDRIKSFNEKTSGDCSMDDAVMGYQHLYNERLFGQNLNMWRNNSIKTILEYDYYQLTCYLRLLNEIAVSDRTVFSLKLDRLRSQLNDHLNKLTTQDKSLIRWKALAERTDSLQIDDINNYNANSSRIRDFCF
ncbi:hypothetical protein M3Y97_00780700 [Aphelenchoides bicaudatus]|nr:hypothetical protein M3Y97_00780700 [Aphelenchoides bicaudatus]